MIEEKDNQRKHPCVNCAAFKDSFVSSFSADEMLVLKDDVSLVSLRKGQEIARQREPAQGVFCIRSGIVKLEEDFCPTSKVTLGFRSTGNLIGHHGIISGESILSATCMTQVEACFFPRKSMLAKAHETPKLLEKINSLLTEEMKEMIAHFVNGYKKPVHQRIIEAILQLEEKFGTIKDGFIAVPLTRQELAQLIGASIEAVFRTLALLKGKKMIQVTKGRIRILDREKLRDFNKRSNYY